ncbi:MAG: hypothetical protein AB7P21_17015 [Lautropia sp.]
MPADTRTLHGDPRGQPTTRSLAMPVSGATADAGPPSTHPDPRLVFAKTPAGVAAIESRSQRVSLAARRLLNLFDGEQPLGKLPPVVRASELPQLVRELETQGMITLAGASSDTAGEHASVHPDVRLGQIKRSLAGVFERELGAQASVLEARVQDCVNLVVLRNVLREVIGLVGQRKDAAAADRIAALVKRHGSF